MAEDDAGPLWAEDRIALADCGKRLERLVAWIKAVLGVGTMLPNAPPPPEVP